MKIVVGGRRWLIPMGEVREVVAMMALQEVGIGGGRFRGIANLRGETVPVFDTADSADPFAPSRFIVIAPLDGKPIGLIVDDVLGLATLDATAIIPVTVGNGHAHRVARIDEQTVAVLRPRDVVNDAAPR